MSYARDDILQARRMARNALLKDIIIYAVSPVFIAWGLWAVFTPGAFPWPLILTVAGIAWGGWRGVRFRQMYKLPAERIRTTEEIHREDVTELPRIRFNDSGDPTDSFIGALQKSRDEPTNVRDNHDQ
jgi:hypothetical protein